MEPRAAKGVMAAAEKKRGNLEQMGNANRKVPKGGDGALVFVGDEDHHHHHHSVQGEEEDEEEQDELVASDREDV
jgi:hypothetical protein